MPFKEQNPESTELEESCVSYLTAISHGDRDAFAAFYDATHAYCYGLALRIVRDRSLAEDVVSETYWQIWRTPGQYKRSRGTPLAWLLMICRTRSIDQTRNRARNSGVSSDEPIADGLVDHDDPSALLTALEERSALREALELLPETPRQILSLAFYRGLSHQEIADFTGLPLGTVKSHLRRGQKTIHDAMQDQLLKSRSAN